MKIFKAFFVICLLALYPSVLHAEQPVGPYVAGSFYPDDPRELSKSIDDFLGKANPQSVDGRICALICPHAGYGYSGPTAAYGYKLLKGKQYKTVVVLGTGHRFGFNGISVYKEGTFRTPLGDIPIDQEFAGKLLDKDNDIYFEPKAFEGEHSVEVQLPFLQKTLSGFKIVPVVVGDTPLSTCAAFVARLKEAIGSRTDIVVIASTDMYHGYDYDEADAFDARTLEAVTAMDAQGLYYGLRERTMQMCGGFGVTITLMLARELGWDKIGILQHTNSAYVTGKKEKGVWTVGYTSGVIYTSNAAPAAAVKPSSEKREGAMLNKDQRKKLLEIARSSIQTYLTTGKRLELSETDPLLATPMGAFVTLNKREGLRGCIGSMTAREPLYLTIRDMAVEAAVGDPRFPQVSAPELKDISIEISVLSPFERVDSADKIILGTHGVMVKRGYSTGVFLPQVATETGWTKEKFLSELCAQKAGLPPGAWKEKSTELYVFTAEVFSEEHY